MITRSLPPPSYPLLWTMRVGGGRGRIAPIVFTKMLCQSAYFVFVFVFFIASIVFIQKCFVNPLILFLYFSLVQFYSPGVPKKFLIKFLDELSFAQLLHWKHWYVQSSNCAKLGSPQTSIRNFFWDTLCTKTPCSLIFSS